MLLGVVGMLSALWTPLVLRHVQAYSIPEWFMLSELRSQSRFYWVSGLRSRSVQRARSKKHVPS